MSPPPDASTAPTVDSPEPAPRSIDTVGGPRKHGWLGSVQYLRDPYRLYEERFAEYGDPVLFTTLEGPVVMTGHPDGVRDMFTADHDTFDVFGANILAPMLGPTSLLLVSGARHKRDRKLLMPAFHGARMRAYGSIMTETARRHASMLVRSREVSIQETTQAISLEVILRAVFGIESLGRVIEFRDAILGLFGPLAPAMSLIPALRVAPFGLGPWARMRQAIANIDALLYEEISARRSASEKGDDILSMLLQARDEQGQGMSDSEVRDELMTLVLAGHETTATALAWALYWLHRPEHGDSLTKLRAELDALGKNPTPEAVASLPYLEAVCNETLRLYPIVPDVPRKLRKPLTLHGVRVPVGYSVGVSVTRVHNREDLYPDPKRFRPERFIERKFGPFEFLSFGGGARRCLGAAFAMYEMKLVLAALLRENYFVLARSEELTAERRGITLGPEKGVPMAWLGPRERAYVV